MPSKKEYERRCLESLRRHTAGFPEGEIVPSERPDFIIAGTQPILGVEVTDLYPVQVGGSTPPQAQESERHIIVRRACETCTEEGVPPLLVAVIFSEGAALSKPRRADLIAVLAHIVQSNIPEPYQQVRLKNRFGSAPVLPREIHSVGIHRIPELTQPSWSPIEAGMVQDHFPDVIQATIDRKGEERQAYLASCNLCWLLIVSGMRSFTPILEASPETLAQTYKSPFERTFYMEAFADRVSELFTSQGNSRGSIA